MPVLVTVMILVKLVGGLGNQMFQYAAALRLAKRHRTVLKLDLEFLLDRTPREGFVHREYSLGIFNPGVEAASRKEILRFERLQRPGQRTVIQRMSDSLSGRCYFREESLAFDRRVLDLPRESYLEGYFQNEGYFADIDTSLRRQFRSALDESLLDPAIRLLAREIQNANSTCLHVRRGDFVSNPTARAVHDVCTLGYYLRGIEELRKRGCAEHVYVFSDDAGWCHEKFGDLKGFHIIGAEHAGPHNSTHLWLMTLCRSFVLPNSTFGWWAAWLCDNPSKLVVRPSMWTRTQNATEMGIYPKEWIELSCV